MQLVVERIAKAFGVHEIFKDISFMIDKGEKIGLVGVNGSGKSTLIRCLLSPSYADGGVIRFEPGIKVGYVEQGFGGIGRESIWSFMLRSCPEILELRDRLSLLEKQAAQGDSETLEAYARVTQRYEMLDGYNYEMRIKRVLIGLAFQEPMWQQNADTLSGGQKTRLMLAAALVKSPDFMILDEPTNHLDIRMMEWLEGYLREFKGGLLLVSHDRAFLDNVATRILEMEGGKLQSFPGNYSKYLVQKEIQTKTLQSAYEAQQDYIAAQEAYIRRFKAGIKSKMARGRQSQLDRLERMDAPVQNDTFELRLPKAPESADRVLILEDLEVGYPDNKLLEPVTLTLRRGDKVGLIGANGTGKTTMLRTILGELPALAGKAQIGNRVQIGYFSQSYERLNPNQTLLDNFLTEYGLTEERTRSLLGGMLFHGDDVFKEIGTLSGGQKARLVLLKLVLDGANCLVLDEPTNHLDILAKETVEAALETFDGTVLVVSHDRYFVNEIANRIWEIEDHQVVDYKGDYRFYTEEKAKRKAAAAEAQATAAAKAAGAAKGQTVGEQTGLRAGTAAEGGAAPAAAVAAQEQQPMNVGKGSKGAKAPGRKHSPQELENLIAKVELSLREQEAMLGVLDKEIALPESHVDPANSARLAAERAAFEEKIDHLMQRWEALLEEQEG